MGIEPDGKETWCLNCYERVKYTIEEKEATYSIFHRKVKYLEWTARCPICGCEVYAGETSDHNVFAIRSAYCDIKGLIKPSQVREILDKYNITPEYLGRLLGWKAGLLGSCLEEGNIPSRKCSRKLYKILNDEKEYNKLVEKYRRKNIE